APSVGVEVQELGEDLAIRLVPEIVCPEPLGDLLDPLVVPEQEQDDVALGAETGGSQGQLALCRDSIPIVRASGSGGRTGRPVPALVAIARLRFALDRL